MARLKAEVCERRQTTETTKFLCLQTLIIFKVKKLMVAHSITSSSGTTFWYYRFRNQHVNVKQHNWKVFQKMWDSLQPLMVLKMVWLKNGSLDT